ncbi:MAG TPA: HemK/PrmC family methyltransferase [Burkholderiales bacterium]|nr:HemK/PrmC family methyltransferase [Burkholderiales bacterium]
MTSIELVLADAAARLATALGLEPESARIEARSLLAHALDRDRNWLALHARDPLSEAGAAAFEALLARRLAGEPVAYLTGRREFFGLDFKITPAVLIPRPETELLVEQALERLPADAPSRVLDLGAGSGCVAITLARHRPRAKVTAVDTSEAALAVARDNARRLLGGGSPTHGVGVPSPLMGEGQGEGEESSFRLVLSDWFSALGDAKYVLVVSNPPYVAEGDPHLAQGDLRFEPRHALAAGADGLDCIRRIVRDAPAHLAEGGWLLFEHGYDQAEDCRNLLRGAGLQDIRSFRDLSGIERVSGARRLTP